jgi:hypothetical protein
MPIKTEPIYKFREKVGVIVETLADAGDIADATLDELCRRGSISLSTLKSALSAYGVTLSLQERLSNVGKFSRSDITWIDRELTASSRKFTEKTVIARHCSERRDTPEAFRGMLRARWGLFGAPSLCLHAAVPQCRDPHLATFLLSDLGQITAPGSPLQVFLKVRFSPGYFKAGYAYGFRAVRIRLELDKEMSQTLRSPLGQDDGPLLIREGQLRCCLPYWEFRTNTGTLNGEYSTAPAPLFVLIDQNPGNAFEAVLEVQVYDGSIAASDGEDLRSNAKRVIISRLIAEELGDELCRGENHNGWVEIARQNCFVAEARREP